MDFNKRPILGGRVNFPVSLAPMVGLTHVALRAVIRRYTPETARTIWPTEMLSSWRLVKEDLGATPETLRLPHETGLVPQILGNEEEPIQTSVEKLADWGAEGIDINMGCPVTKALKHNYGVALMGDAGYAAQVVRFAAKGRKLPVSVKLRAGLQNDLSYLKTFVRGLEDAGADWVTLHPRVGHMKRRGQADWAQIRQVRDHVGLAILGNGDVQCAEDVFAMAEQTGCDGVVVGRALAARPWLMWQVGEKLGFPCPEGFSGSAPKTPEEEGCEFGRAALSFIDELEKAFSWDEGGKRFRFYLRMTIGWLEFGQHLFGRSSRAKSYEELRAVVQDFFASEQRMFPRTALRE